MKKSETGKFTIYEEDDACSLDEYSDTLAKELETEFKKVEINQSLESENELLKDQIPQGQDNGENITLNDSSNMPFKKFIVEGKSEQETRSGKNIFDKNNPNILNAYINNNIVTEESQNRIIWLACKPNTNYTVQKKAGQSFAVYFSNEEPGIGSTVTNGKSDNTNTYITNSSSNNSNYIIIYCANYNVAEEISWQDILDTLQVKEGTEATDYEPYGVMPSPEFPSKIENVEGDVNVNVCNKNLFNSKKIPSGSIITVNDDYSITLQNNSNSIGYVDTGKKLKEICKGLKQGETIFLKLITTFSKYIYLMGANVIFNDGESKVLTEKMLESNIAIYGGYQSTDTLQIQITKNNLEDYIPHQEQIATFPLSQGQKLMLGDYLAEDGIHHVRKQIELNGTESWQKGAIADVNLYSINVDNIIITGIGEGLCTHAINLAKDFKAIDGRIRFSWDSNKIYFYSTCATTEEWKTYLAQQKAAGTPVIVEYELAEEEIEVYTDEQQTAYEELKKLATYKNVTNIFSTDEISPIFDITYFKDLETMFNNLSKAILEGGN